MCREMARIYLHSADELYKEITDENRSVYMTVCVSYLISSIRASMTWLAGEEGATAGIHFQTFKGVFRGIARIHYKTEWYDWLKKSAGGLSEWDEKLKALEPLPVTPEQYDGIHNCAESMVKYIELSAEERNRR